MTLDTLNRADETTFVNTLGFIFEHSPWVARRAWPLRPFATIDVLHAHMCAIVNAAPLEERLALIAAHPDLAGNAALAGALGAASAREQASAGLNRLDREDGAILARLNAAYHGRFDFPFVICVRETNASGIRDALERRMQNDRSTEIAIALAEIAKIARLRLRDTIVS